MRDYEAELLEIIRSSEDPGRTISLILAEAEQMLDEVQATSDSSAPKKPKQKPKRSPKNRNMKVTTRGTRMQQRKPTIRCGAMDSYNKAR